MAYDGAVNIPSGGYVASGTVSSMSSALPPKTTGQLWPTKKG